MVELGGESEVQKESCKLISTVCCHPPCIQSSFSSSSPPHHRVGQSMCSLKVLRVLWKLFGRAFWEVVFRGALLSISPGIQLTLLRRTAEQTFPVHDDDDDDHDDDHHDHDDYWTKGVVGRDMVAPPTAGDSQDRQKCKKKASQHPPQN